MNKYPYHKSEQDWKEQLDEESYRILREKGTEYPHSGAFNMHFEDGTYLVVMLQRILIIPLKNLFQDMKRDII